MDVDTIRNNLRLAVSQFSEQEFAQTTRRSFMINNVEATFIRTTTDSGQFQLAISIDSTYSIYLRMPPDRYISNIRDRLLTLAAQWRPDRWNGISIHLDGQPGAVVSAWNTGVSRTRLSTVSEEAASSHVHAASSRMDSAATPLAPLVGVSSSSSGRPISQQEPAVHNAGIEQTTQQAAPVESFVQGTSSQTHHVRTNSYDPFEIHQRASLDGRPSQDRNSVDSSRRSSDPSSRPTTLSLGYTHATPHTSVQGSRGSSSIPSSQFSQFSQLLDGSVPSDMSSRWGSGPHSDGARSERSNSLSQNSDASGQPSSRGSRASFDSNRAGNPSSQPRSPTDSRRSDRSNSSGQRSDTSGQHISSPRSQGRDSFENAAERPSNQPSGFPSSYPSNQPSGYPSGQPSGYPSNQPSGYPSGQPSGYPLNQPSGYPSGQPSAYPSNQPSGYPSVQPSGYPALNHPRGYPIYPSRGGQSHGSPGPASPTHGGHHPSSIGIQGHTSFGNPAYSPNHSSRNRPSRHEDSDGENSD